MEIITEIDQNAVHPQHMLRTGNSSIGHTPALNSGKTRTYSCFIVFLTSKGNKFKLFVKSSWGIV